MEKQNWVEINDESHRTYNKDNQIRFKTSTSRSSLCYYCNAYIVTNTGKDATPNNANKKVIFKNCAPLAA